MNNISEVFNQYFQVANSRLGSDAGLPNNLHSKDHDLGVVIC
jgi:hypothetical protein